jgi:hypothetical protein
MRSLPGSEGAIPLGIAEFAVVGDTNSFWYIRVIIYGHVVGED